MSLCLCGKSGRNHEITDACLTPDEQELVRRFEAEYDRRAAKRALAQPSTAPQTCPDGAQTDMTRKEQR